MFLVSSLRSLQGGVSNALGAMAANGSGCMQNTLEKIRKTIENQNHRKTEKNQIETSENLQKPYRKQ